MVRSSGAANQFYVLLLLGGSLLAGLGYLLFVGMGSPQRADGQPAQTLTLYCAAGMRYPMEQIVERYSDEYGVEVRLLYGGSNTLYSQLKVSGAGDLYLAADEFYILKARQAGLAVESLTLAYMRPVIAVQKQNDTIHGIDDLLAANVRVALGNPDAAAVGMKTKKLLTKSGNWTALEQNVTAHGVSKPTVNEVANDIKIGSVTAGIIWDSTVGQYPELKSIRVPELDAGASTIQMAVLSSSKNSAAALHFARYVAARDRGLISFQENGFEAVEGDSWADRPELTFFAGSVNRRALEPVIQSFERREGVRVNTVYNGCGILTAQMKSVRKDHAGSFPDVYMACDVYYLEVVQDWFRDGVNVSDTAIVIVVQEGNPKNIRSLKDLARPGMRVAIGQPEQCTIGVLTRRLLEDARVYQQLIDQKNIVTQSATSALLVPTVATNSADAALAYVSDTLSETSKVDVVAIDSPLAKAVQPFSIARSSEYQQLGQRLFEAIGRSRESFESAGFNWRLDKPAATSEAGGGPAAAAATDKQAAAAPPERPAAAEDQAATGSESSGGDEGGEPASEPAAQATATGLP